MGREKTKGRENGSHFLNKHFFAYCQTLGTIIHWVCTDIWYVQTLGMFRHWVRSDIGYVKTLGMFRHWLCSDIGMFRYWVCPYIGYVQTLDMFIHWVCSDMGQVLILGMFRHWLCLDIVYVQTLGTFRCGIIKKVRKGDKRYSTLCTFLIKKKFRQKKFRQKLEAVVTYLNNTPPPQLPAIQMSTLPPTISNRQ